MIFLDDRLNEWQITRDFNLLEGLFVWTGELFVETIADGLEFL
jgi:hypothetical protein